jgi:hypothetical protein
MGDDEGVLLGLWRENRGEVEAEDLSGNLIVQLRLATEDLNRRCYDANTGQVITDIQKQVWHPALRWMAATLDGRVQGSDADSWLWRFDPKASLGTDAGLFSPCRKEGQPPAASFAITNRDPGNFY